MSRNTGIKKRTTNNVYSHEGIRGNERCACKVPWLSEAVLEMRNMTMPENKSTREAAFQTGKAG